MNINDELEKLQQAKDKEEQQIKLLVLKLLHWNSIIAFDASANILEKDLELAILPAPTDNKN